MALIDVTYFNGVLKLANLDTTYVVARLNEFINWYEYDLLERLLGRALHSAFITGLAVVPTPETRWLVLRDGAAFTNIRTGAADAWPGFLYTTQPGSVKKSSIAAYVYCKYNADQQTQTLALGEAAAKAELAERTTPAFKTTVAWNMLAADVRKLVDYLDSNEATYPEWVTFKQTGCYNRERVLNDFRATNAMGI